MLLRRVKIASIELCKYLLFAQFELGMRGSYNGVPSFCNCAVPSKKRELRSNKLSASSLIVLTRAAQLSRDRQTADNIWEANFALFSKDWLLFFLNLFSSTDA